MLLMLLMLPRASGSLPYLFQVVFRGRIRRIINSLCFSPPTLCSKTVILVVQCFLQLPLIAFYLPIFFNKNRILTRKSRQESIMTRNFVIDFYRQRSGFLSNIGIIDMQSPVIDHAEMIRLDYVFNTTSRETKVYTCIIIILVMRGA